MDLDERMGLVESLAWLCLLTAMAALIGFMAWQKASDYGWGIVFFWLAIAVGFPYVFIGIDAWARRRDRKRLERLTSELIATQQQWKHEHGR